MLIWRHAKEIGRSKLCIGLLVWLNAEWDLSRNKKSVMAKDSGYERAHLNLRFGLAISIKTDCYLRTVINNIVRFVVLLSVVSLVSMLLGWNKVDMIAVSVDIIMLAIFASNEYDISDKRKNKSD